MSCVSFMILYPLIQSYVPEKSKNALNSYYFKMSFSILPTGTITVHSSSMNRTRVYESDKTGTLSLHVIIHIAIRNTARILCFDIFSFSHSKNSIANGSWQHAY